MQFFSGEGGVEAGAGGRLAKYERPPEIYIPGRKFRNNSFVKYRFRNNLRYQPPPPDCSCPAPGTTDFIYAHFQLLPKSAIHKI